MLGKPLPVQNNQLVQRLVPVSVALCPFLYHVPTGGIKHLFQCAITWKYTFCLCHFPVLAVQPLYDVCRIHDAPDIIRKLEKGTDIFPVVLPITYCIRILLFVKLDDAFIVTLNAAFGAETTQMQQII